MSKTKKKTDETIDVGVFSARRYRLSSYRASVTTFAYANAEISWYRDRLRVNFVCGPDHRDTLLWINQHPPGTWITLECWEPFKPPPIPDPEQAPPKWNAMRVKLRIGTANEEGFTGYRDRTPGPGFEVFSAYPPSTQGVSLAGAG